MFTVDFPAVARAVCITLCLGGAVALAPSGSLAQSTESTTDTEQTTDTSNVGSQLSMGPDANAPDDLGQPYTRETNGAWELRCLRTEVPEDDPCQMYQLLDDGEGQPVAEFSLFRLPEGGQATAGATVIVPLETSLQDQLTVQIDGGGAKRYPFAFCNQVGCYARIGLTVEDIDAYKRGAQAIMTIVPALAPDQQVRLTLSLSGFTASYANVSVIAP